MGNPINELKKVLDEIGTVADLGIPPQPAIGLVKVMPWFGRPMGMGFGVGRNFSRKHSKNDVNYVSESETKGETCDNCSYFIGDSCRIVEGDISSKGHCRLWSAG